MPYLEIERDRFYYAGNIKQKGVPIIFCHGSGGRHHHWLYQLKGLPETINPIAVDLPGHGRSEGKPADDVAVYAEWLNRFVKTAGLGPFILCGHSLGGAIALTYAIKHQEETLGLILVGTGARLRVLPAFLDALREGTVPPAFTGYLYSPDVSEELMKKGKKEVEDTAASIYYADLSACDKFDIMENLEQVNCPTLIICGSEDRLTPVKYSRYLEERLPHSRAEIIDGAGHMVMLEKPQAVNEAIARFVSEEIK